MASCPFRRVIPRESYQLAILFLAIAALLHLVTFIPASPLLYLIRADFSNADSSFVGSTAWFSVVGHCLADASHEISPAEQTYSGECSYTLLGYDLDGLFQQAGITTPRLSHFLTSSLVILHLLAVMFNLISIAAYQLIWLCHTHRVRLHWGMYLCSMGSSMLAFFVSVVAFVYECGFLASIARSYPEVVGATFTTTYGPTAYAAMWALFFELVASSVGFYNCIGGKYHCEDDVFLVLDDEEEGTVGFASDPGPDEKSRLLIV